MFDMTTYHDKASGLAHGLKAKLTEIDQADWLSGEGKRQRSAEARAEYDAAVARLREEASTALGKEREKVARELATARAERAKAERELLTPAVMAQLLQARLEKATPAELVEAVRTARDDWERALTIHVARALLPTESPDEQTAMAAQDLRSLASEVDPGTAELERQDRDLGFAERELDRLDPLNYAKSLGDVYGVNPAYIPA